MTSLNNRINNPNTIKNMVVILSEKKVIGRLVSKILDNTPHASANVGIRKKIHAKLTKRNVTMIFILLPNQP